MTQEDQKHVQELKNLSAKLTEIYDDYHHEIYLNDEICSLFIKIEQAIQKEIIHCLIK
jgi:hypothetical protein